MCEAIEGIRNDGIEERFLKALIGLVKDGTGAPVGYTEMPYHV